MSIFEKAKCVIKGVVQCPSRCTSVNFSLEPPFLSASMNLGCVMDCFLERYNDCIKDGDNKRSSCKLKKTL